MSTLRDQSLSPEALRRGERLLLAESACAKMMGTATSGLYLTGFALALGANELQVGKLAGAVYVGGVFQFLVVPSVRWLGSRRWFCITCLGITRLMRFAMAASPLFLMWGMSPANVIWLLYGCLLLGAITGTAAETVRQSWMTDLVPVGQLGRFIGWRSAIGSAAGIVSAVIFSQFIEYWRRGGHAPVAGFQWLTVIGACIGIGGLICLARAPDPPLAEARQATSGWSELSIPFRDRGFRAFMLFQTAWTAAAGIGGMFFHLYMLDHLGLRHRTMGYALIAATDILSEVLSMAMAPVWGGMADRWGTRRMLLLAAGIQAVYPLLWVFITPGLWPLVFVVVLAQASNSGLEIGPMTLAMQMAPERHRSVYLSTYRSLACLMTAIAPVVGGAIALRLGGAAWIVGGLTFTGLHLVFMLSSVGRLLSLSLLKRVGHVSPSTRPTSVNQQV